jgi:hypothetical protein
VWPRGLVLLDQRLVVGGLEGLRWIEASLFLTWGGMGDGPDGWGSGTRKERERCPVGGGGVADLPSCRVALSTVGEKNFHLFSIILHFLHFLRGNEASYGTLIHVK